MAPPDHFTGSKISIQIGDGASPEVFAHPCLINSTRAVEGTATTIDTVVPDCADPEAPAWTNRDKDALSYQITGEGIMDAVSTEPYINWLKDALTKNVRAVINNGGVGQTLAGAFHLTSFNVNGERKGKAQVSITLVSDGVIANSANV